MTSSIEISGKKYESVSTASKLTSYSRDYIGRLAREGKVDAIQVGRQWFVSIPSLQLYADHTEKEQEARKEKLSLERKREREDTARIRGSEQAPSAALKENVTRQKILAGAVLSLGVGLGVVLNIAFYTDTPSESQVARPPEVDSLVPVEQKFPVATGETVEQISLEAIDFSEESMSISTLNGDGQGILLLPNLTDTHLTEAEVKLLFSDPIELVKDEAGNQYVIRKTADGKEERLPFAVVPVTSKEAP